VPGLCAGRSLRSFACNHLPAGSSGHRCAHVHLPAHTHLLPFACAPSPAGVHVHLFTCKVQQQCPNLAPSSAADARAPGMFFFYPHYFLSLFPRSPARCCGQVHACSHLPAGTCLLVFARRYMPAGVYPQMHGSARSPAGACLRLFACRCMPAFVRTHQFPHGSLPALVHLQVIAGRCTDPAIQDTATLPVDVACSK